MISSARNQLARIKYARSWHQSLISTEEELKASVITIEKYIHAKK